MSSRDKILGTVKANQPEQRALPSLEELSQVHTRSGEGNWPAGGLGENSSPDLSKQFVEVLEAIGGRAFIVSGWQRIGTILKEEYAHGVRIVTSCEALAGAAEVAAHFADAHSLENVELA